MSSNESKWAQISSDAKNGLKWAYTNSKDPKYIQNDPIWAQNRPKWISSNVQAYEWAEKSLCDLNEPSWTQTFIKFLPVMHISVRHDIF